MRGQLHLTLTPLHALYALLAIAWAFVLVVGSGILPLTASSGHWPVTAWFLHTVMRRSVAFHAMGIDPPPLDERRLRLVGAGHFDGGCRPCHGRPGRAVPTIPMQMTPHPPNLSERAGDWGAEDLFYIVKHGVKFTGMPAWPALERDDEVWAVVAFLEVLPELDAAGYRALVYPPDPEPLAGIQTPEIVLETCARCHGRYGAGREDAFPILAGQKPAYLEASLVAYAEGERESGIMQPIAAAMDLEQIAAVSRYYASLPRPRVAEEVDEALVARGAAIARGEAGAPSCSHCHGPTEHPRHPLFPELAGQPVPYLVQQLELFVAGTRGGTAWANVMRTVAKRSPVPHGRLDPEEIAALAAYYHALD